jgi:hypothetical protein
VLILFVVMPVLLAWATWRHSGDDRATDDSSMLPVWSERGGAANPLAVFCNELAATPIHDVKKLAPEVLKRAKGTEAQVRDFLRGQDQAFSAFEKLMATPASSWQWPGGARIAEPSYPTDYFASFGEMIQLLRMKAHLLCVDGHAVEAAKLALKSGSFGRGLNVAEGTYMQMLIAIAAQTSGEDALREALTSAPASAAHLHFCLDELQRYGSLLRADCEFAVRAEYLGFKHNLDKIQRGTIVFRHHKSFAEWRGLTKPIIKGLDSSWKEGLAAVRASDKIVDGFPSRARPLSFIDSNVAGKLLIKLSWSSSSKMIEKAILSVTLHEQAEVMLALRLYELEHGSPPATLAELVPQYLPALPMDEFSGRPMLWNNRSGDLYSVGLNGKDDGGTINLEKPRKGADVGMRYWWVKNPP